MKHTHNVREDKNLQNFYNDINTEKCASYAPISKSRLTKIIPRPSSYKRLMLYMFKDMACYQNSF